MVVVAPAATPPAGAANGAPVADEEGHGYLHLTHQAHPAGGLVDQGRTGSLDAGKETLKSFGSELKAFYLTMGRYDFVAISEAPDDAAAAKVALAIGSAGNVTTETLTAFTEAEYREIVHSGSPVRYS